MSTFHIIPGQLIRTPWGALETVDNVQDCPDRTTRVCLVGGLSFKLSNASKARAFFPLNCQR
jgi:hypothetical protein